MFIYPESLYNLSAKAFEDFPYLWIFFQYQMAVDDVHVPPPGLFKNTNGQYSRNSGLSALRMHRTQQQVELCCRFHRFQNVDESEWEKSSFCFL